MRKSKACPKCRSNDIVRIPGMVGPFGSGNCINVGKTIFSSVTVTRYLCVTCGFSEEWVEAADDLAKIKKRYAS